MPFCSFWRCNFYIYFQSKSVCLSVKFRLVHLPHIPQRRKDYKYACAWSSNRLLRTFVSVFCVLSLKISRSHETHLVLDLPYNKTTYFRSFAKRNTSSWLYALWMQQKAYAVCELFVRLRSRLVPCVLLFLSVHTRDLKPLLVIVVFSVATITWRKGGGH